MFTVYYINVQCVFRKCSTYITKKFTVFEKSSTCINKNKSKTKINKNT